MKGIDLLNRDRRGWKHILCALSMCLVFLSGHTQDDSRTVLDLIDPTFQNASLRYDQAYAQMEGSPFAFDDWRLATLETQTGKMISGVKVKYDMYAQNLVVRMEEEEMVLADQMIKRCTLFDEQARPFVFEQVRLTAGGSPEYVQVLWQNTGSMLIKRTEVKVQKVENTSGGYGTGANTLEVQRFSHQSTYLARMDAEGTFQAFRPKKKEVLSLLADQKEAIQDFLKKEKISLNSDEDLAEVFAYYDQLTS